MANVEEEYFCRLQLLSTKGVTPVLVKVLEDVVRNTCNGDVDKFLTVFKNEILELKKKKVIYEAAYLVLFPPNGKTDIYTWDISLLTCILLNCCTLEGRCNKKNWFLIKLLKQEVVNNGTGIQAFLATNKGRLDQNLKNQLSDIQYDQIYPKSGGTVDITTWDFEVLAIVLSVCSTGVRSQDLKDLLKPLVKLETDLSQFNTDLVAFLRKHATLLDNLHQTGIISNQQHELLYPSRATYPDINIWDQGLLVIVVLNACRHLKRCSIEAIKSLRSLRNEKFAHASSPEIEETPFRTLWKMIVDKIETVIENDIQGYTIQVWNDSVSHIRSGPLNKQESIDILKEWYKEGDETSKKLTETNEKLTETNEKLTETNENVTKLQQNVNNISEAQRQGFEGVHTELKEIKDAIKLKELSDNVQVISMKRPDVYESRVEIRCVDIKIVLQGNDVEAVRKAEDFIRQAMKNEVEDTKKRNAALLSLYDIKAISTIKKEITKEGSVIEGIVEGSIILRMRCHSLIELDYLLRLESQLQMKVHFDELAAVVGPIVGDSTITIKSGITDYSINELNTEVKSICLTSGIKIQLYFSGYQTLNPNKSADDIELPILVKDDNQHTLEVTADSMTDDDVGTTDDPSQDAGPLHEKKSFRAEKIGTYTINYPDDDSEVSVNSCVVLPTGDIAVCDYRNRNIMLFDEFFTSRDLIKVEHPPHDSSLSLDDNAQVLVTIPDEKYVYTIIKIDNRLSQGRKLRVNGECRGITCLATGIAVTVKRDSGRWEIQLLQYDGKRLKTILPYVTPQLELDSPFYMTSVDRLTNIIISDPSTKCLTSLDVDTGRVEFVYKDPSLRRPQTVTSDEANIYVLDRGSTTVHVISSLTGFKIRDILTDTDGLHEPLGLCYNKRNGTFLLQPDREKNKMCVYKTMESFRAEKIQTSNNIEYQEDKSEVCVNSCVMLPTGDIVVCDNRNRNIKLFDEAFTKRDLLKLEKYPRDLSLSLDDNTLVFVTIPDKKSIYTIKVDKILKKGKKLPVDGECHGITCLVTGIAVSVERGGGRWEIQLMQYDGQLLKTIRPDTTPRLKLKQPYYMTTINRATLIVISDPSIQCLTAVDVNAGRVEFVYRDLSLSYPENVTSDSQDNIYVADEYSGIVRMISKTGEIGEILTATDGLNGPRVVCYNKRNNTLLLQPDREKTEICVYNIVKSFRAERLHTYNIEYKKYRVIVDSCVVLPTGDIVVCDQENRNITLFDEAFTRRDLLQLEKYPGDSSLSLDDKTQVLVTIPLKWSIYNISVDNRVIKGRELRVDGECHGITCLVTGIAVSVERGGGRWEIQLLQYDGQLLKTILPDTTPQLELRQPYNMTSINGGRKIILSDWGTKGLTAVDVDTGRVEFVYSDPSLQLPYSVTFDSEDNLYVADYERPYTVHVISSTGEKIGDILTHTEGLDRPGGLCYNKLNDTLLLQSNYRKPEICEYKIVKDDV